MSIRITRECEVDELDISFEAQDNYEKMRSVFDGWELDGWIDSETGIETDESDVEAILSGELRDVAERACQYIHHRPLNKDELNELCPEIEFDEDGNEIRLVFEPDNQMKLFPEMEKGLPPAVIARVAITH